MASGTEAWIAKARGLDSSSTGMVVFRSATPVVVASEESPPIRNRLERTRRPPNLCGKKDSFFYKVQSM